VEPKLGVITRSLFTTSSIGGPAVTPFPSEPEQQDLAAAGPDAAANAAFVRADEPGRRYSSK
jgi:hypothetical protein